MIVKPMNHFGMRAATLRLLLLGLALVFAVFASTAAQASDPVANQPPLMERQREITLALSACPTSVASKAAVYILQLSGYVKVRESENGFTAIVQHLLPTSVEPLCMNEEGTRTHLPQVLRVAELRAQGKNFEQIKRIMDDAFAKGIFQPPSRTSVGYMLSTENVVPNDKGVVEPFPPHVMFYVPYLTNAELGAAIGPDGNPTGAAFVAREGTRDATIIIPIGAHTGPSHPSAGSGAGASRERGR